MCGSVLAQAKHGCVAAAPALKLECFADAAGSNHTAKLMAVLAFTQRDKLSWGGCGRFWAEGYACTVLARTGKRDKQAGKAVV